MTEKNTAKFTLKLCQNVFSIILSLHLSQCKHLGHYYWTCVVMTRIFSGRWQWDPNWQRDEHHDIEILECITVRTLCLLYKGWELHRFLMHMNISIQSSVYSLIVSFDVLGGLVDPLCDCLQPVEPAGPAGAVPLPLPPLLAGQAPSPGIEHNLTAELLCRLLDGWKWWLWLGFKTLIFSISSEGFRLRNLFVAYRWPLC